MKLFFFFWENIHCILLCFCTIVYNDGKPVCPCTLNKLDIWTVTEGHCRFKCLLLMSLGHLELRFWKEQTWWQEREAGGRVLEVGMYLLG